MNPLIFCAMLLVATLAACTPSFDSASAPAGKRSAEEACTSVPEGADPVEWRRLHGCDAEPEAIPSNSARDIAIFRRAIRPEMTFAEIKDAFGPPTEDRGSGIHIYVYQLADGSEVWIGYTDKILYARHRNADGSLQEDLLPKDAESGSTKP